MTYAEYKKDTFDNCMKVLEDCGDSELVMLDHLKRLLYEDDNVTGVMSGRCSSANSTVLSNINEILFDEEFLADFNKHGLNMQTVMAYGAEAIDVAARCLALSHIRGSEARRSGGVNCQMSCQSVTSGGIERSLFYINSCLYNSNN